ncbi:MAG: ABC transporter ATP-binding protein/permease [Clostridiaceae bacterium]|jgi:ATP-binding cassette subfamily B protein|nr:ABC transporter ATP-binding protein/permease [Clostridiaceae bacterium]
MKSALKYLKPYGGSAIWGMLFKFAETVLELFLPLTMAYMVESASKGAEFSQVLRLSGVMLVIIALCIVLSVSGQFFAAKASTFFGRDLRTALFSKINSLSFKETDSFGTPSLVNRLTNDTSQIQSAVFMVIRIGLRAPFVAIGALVMAFALDSFVALVFLAVIPFVAIAITIILKRTVPIYGSVQKKLDDITAVTRENVSGARVIRAYSRQEHENVRTAVAAESYKKESLRVNRIAALLNPISSLIIQLGIVGILIVGGYRAQADMLEPAILTAFITYILQILLAVNMVATVIVILIRAVASAKRIEEVLNAKGVASDGYAVTGGDGLDRSAPAAEFKDVYFGYSCANVLKDVSFAVNRGEKLGIIGGTGSGKTTLINLIPAFYGARSGEVRVFGRDVKDIDPRYLRSLVTAVSQKAVLISGTVRENVAFGRQISDEEATRALYAAQAEFVFESQEGLDKHIERDGSNISGGQKQRISIARALAGNPEILILDDSSSALDYATDAALYAALRTEYPELTVITVSQRVYAVRRADTILVMHNGKIEAAGAHSELYAASPLYEEICRSQGVDL